MLSHTNYCVTLKSFKNSWQFQSTLSMRRATANLHKKVLEFAKNYNFN